MWSHIEFVSISPKTYEKLQHDDVSAWYCPICGRSLLFSDLRTKELRIFLSSDTIEHTKTTKKTINKQTYELMKKFSQISQLNDPNEDL